MFVPRIDLLTRLELFLRRKNLAPLAVAQAAAYSRQHVLRMRLGEVGPTRRFVLALTAACKRLSGEPVTPGMLFERGDELLQSPHQRLSRLFREEFRVLDAFLSDVSGEEWAERFIAARAGSETAVRYLLEKGKPRIDKNARDAAAIFSAATAMAAALQDSAPELIASLQAHALKGRANALRHLDELDAALTDLSLAEKLFTKALYCVSETGQVEYTRGTVLFKMERWEDARTAAHQARAWFVATGDARRAAHADLLDADILFEQGHVNAARDQWLRLLSILTDLDDAEALARVRQNLGACETSPHPTPVCGSSSARTPCTHHRTR